MHRRAGAGQIAGAVASGDRSRRNLSCAGRMKRLLEHTKRIIRITGGIVVIVLGIILSVPGVPGPGLLVIFAGLSILAVDFVWAHRLKTKMKDTAVKVVDKVRGKPSDAEVAAKKP